MKEKLRVDLTDQVEFDFSVADNFEVFDLIEDTKQKSWLVVNVNAFKNKIKIVKFPVLKNQEQNTFHDLDLDNASVVSSITKIFR